MREDDVGIGENEFTTRPELVKTRARYIAVRRIAVTLTVMALAMVLLLLSWDSYNGAKDRERLLDCTTPGGECYEAQQARTAGAVAGIIDGVLGGQSKSGAQLHDRTREIVVLAAYCAERPGIDTVKEIKVCIEDELRDE